MNVFEIMKEKISEVREEGSIFLKEGKTEEALRASEDEGYRNYLFELYRCKDE